LVDAGLPMLTAIDRHLPNGAECKTKPTPSTYSPPSFLGVVASWRFDRFCKTNPPRSQLSEQATSANGFRFPVIRPHPSAITLSSAG
jgi:hypothetical protein